MTFMEQLHMSADDREGVRDFPKRDPYEIIKDLRQKLEKAEAKNREWNIEIAGHCTASGSEFHDDPKRCRAYIRARYDDGDRLMKMFAKKARDAEKALQDRIETYGESH